MTLEADSTPSTAIDAAASAKKFAADAPCIDSHQPPSPINNTPALCPSTAPITLPATWEEKYIDIASPIKAYIGPAIDRYCRLAARTPTSRVKISTQRSGKIAISVPIKPTDTNETRPAVQAIRLARAIRPAPIAMPTMGTEAIPPANATDVIMNSSHPPSPY